MLKNKKPQQMLRFSFTERKGLPAIFNILIISVLKFKKGSIFAIFGEILESAILL